MASHRGFKQWRLSKTEETITSFEDWRSNLCFTLKQDRDFAPFLKKGVSWSKAKIDPSKRGLEAVAGKTAEERADDLVQMLESISSFSPWVRKASIVDNTKCLDDVWQAIRLHYGFKTSGANFIDFVNIKLDPNERHEDLYQRMASFIDDNLLKKNDKITHDGDEITSDEVLSPSLENLIVLLWLEKIHPKLPALVKQKYATELRSKTLFSLKPEISMSIPSLLEEVSNIEDARVMRLGAQGPRRPSSYQPSPYQQQPRRNPRDSQKRPPECCLCKQAGRPDFSHWVSSCKYFPERDRRFFSKTRMIMGLLEDTEEGEEEVYEDAPDDTAKKPNIRGVKTVVISEEKEVKESNGNEEEIARGRGVMIKECPVLNVFHGNNPATMTMDCGAEADLIRHNIAVSLGLKIEKSRHGTTQLDGKTPLVVCGEVHTKFTRDGRDLFFSGLVVEEMDVDILGSTPFLDRNDITIRTHTNELIFNDGTTIVYKARIKSHDAPPPAIRRCALLRVEETQTLWPGDSVDFRVKETSFEDLDVAVEPRSDLSAHSWLQPELTKAVNGVIRLTNTSSEPQTIKKHEHLGEVSSTFSPPVEGIKAQMSLKQTVNTPRIELTDIISQISIDPDKVLPNKIRQGFHDLHNNYKEVFDPQFQGYNHAYGRFEAVVNMGNVKPPQRKGKLPQYSRNKLVQVQEHFDQLEKLGVLAKPELVGVNVEYLNPSFLVKKGENGFRLVTAFTEVGKYCKPQPTLLPTVDSTLRTVAHWNFLIKTDLKAAYHQIPLSKESMKYCGTPSPFKGTRVYTRCAMGMPGSETALEELLCRIVGDLLTKGNLVKMADDLYCGGETGEKLLENWTEVVMAFHSAGIKLTAAKTIIAPTETLMLGWVWKNGKLEASPHKIAALSKCTKPTTVKDMRSFLGAYKVLSRVIPQCSIFLQQLNRSTSGKVSHQRIEWDEPLERAFTRAQKHLESNKVIWLPRETDELFIVTDGATTNPVGVGATLYIRRDGKLRLSGFFSQQLNPVQTEKWFPCEVEGIAIAAAIKFWNAYIAQSSHRTKVLTDSKPCRDAYNLLCRGEFSSNARLTTFLNTVSRYHVTISHLSGEANAPSDFGSRNAIECVSDKCQVCMFTRSLEASVVRLLSVADVKSGRAQVPFTNRRSWIETQSECPDLRRVKAQLIQGTRPSKKETTIPNVKRYLNKVTIANDGLLVVRKSDPLSSTREAIVVPVAILPGLTTALHIRFDHPTSNELMTIMDRSFFGLNMSKVVEEVTASCHTCASLAKVPKSLVTCQSTSEPPACFGNQFASDIIRRERQLILVAREYMSSYTLTKLVMSEQKRDLRDALVELLIQFIPMEGPMTVVRTDPAPGFKSLVNDETLRYHRIQVEVGESKNDNKNPVAERAVQEFEEVLRKMDTHGEAINDHSLAIATARLNNKVRTNGLSSREILMQRDQFTNNHIPISDREIILEKHVKALKSRESFEKGQAMGKESFNPPNINVGDLVHLYNDRDKHHPRHRYIVTSIDTPWLQIRKFTNNQLRSLPYRVKIHDVYKVPSQCNFKANSYLPQVEDDHPGLAVETFKESYIDDHPPEDDNNTSAPVHQEDDLPEEITSPPSDNDLVTPDVPEKPSDTAPVQHRRPQRLRRPPGYLEDYET